MKLTELLTSSRATPDFRDAVARFLVSAQPNERIGYDAARAPHVKVERTLTKMLEGFPDLPIDAVQLTSVSGCEFFRGTLLISTPQEERTVEFDWDCRWRAEQQGWRDAFGFPDQIRAAREFGHDCFQTWSVRTIADAECISVRS